ncbi:hypothetical protein CDD82_3771 [Ophiocordyceps australis]|uniref:Uncharacterized protein n=1 Tax=Ophiocordyceps australis TaxID=1399860 RepID=A0A2C5ZAH8_9HYPO|nr:hypothetical protein CDD82_3771 [Ophiocordyceps australis]
MTEKQPSCVAIDCLESVAVPAKSGRKGEQNLPVLSFQSFAVPAKTNRVGQDAREGEDARSFDSPQTRDYAFAWASNCLA